MRNKQFLGHIAAMVSIFVWGFSYVPIVTLLQEFSPFEILFFRFALAVIVLYLIYPKRMKKISRREEFLFAAAGLSGVTLYFLLQDFALLNAAASNVGVIVTIAPVFTVLLSWRFLDEGRPAKIFFLGAALALFGIGLISFGASRATFDPLGDLLAVLAAFSWAVYCIFTKKISAYGHHVIQVTRRIFTYGLLFLVPVMLVTDFRFGFARFTALPNLMSILLLGGFASAMCFLFWNFALRELGAVKTTVYIYLAPLVTVLASVFVLRETVTWIHGVGIVFTLGGVVLSNLRAKARTEEVEEV